MQKEIKRCGWVKLNDPLYIAYHDNEWGKPLYDDSEIFALLVLESQQAGLSWQTLLHKREAYMREFSGLSIDFCASLCDEDIEAILMRGEVLKNRAKLRAIRANAIAAKKLIDEFGSLSDYFWARVDYTPIYHDIECYKDAPTRDDLSDEIAWDLKERGFKFIGSVTIYAFLQAMGVINDHERDCAFKNRG